MKKTFTLVLALLLSWAMTGCGGGGDVSAAYQSGYDDGYSAGLTDAALPKPSTTSQPEDSGSRTESRESKSEARDNTAEAGEPQIGSRKNPVPLGQAVEFTSESYTSGSGKVRLSLLEIVRGDAAWDMVLDANMFNDPPENGKEYLCVKVEMTFLEDLTGEDKPLKSDKYDFDYADGGFSVSNGARVVEPEPEFDVQLYEGATSSGWVTFLVEKDETNPYAIYADAIWFQLF